MSEVNWIKVPYPEYFVPPENTVYILPCGEDNKCAIFCGGEVCVIEGIDVAECVAKLKAMDDALTFKERIDMVN